MRLRALGGTRGPQRCSPQQPARWRLSGGRDRGRLLSAARERGRGARRPSSVPVAPPQCFGDTDSDSTSVALSPGRETRIRPPSYSSESPGTPRGRGERDQGSAQGQGLGWMACGKPRRPLSCFQRLLSPVLTLRRSPAPTLLQMPFRNQDGGQGTPWNWFSAPTAWILHQVTSEPHGAPVQDPHGSQHDSSCPLWEPSCLPVTLGPTWISQWPPCSPPTPSPGRLPWPSPDSSLAGVSTIMALTTLCDQLTFSPRTLPLRHTADTRVSPVMSPGG